MDENRQQQLDEINKRARMKKRAQVKEILSLAEHYKNDNLTQQEFESELIWTINR